MYKCCECWRNKTKFSEISITAQVSTPQKRVCTGIGSVKNVQTDCAYYPSSSRLQWKVDGLISQIDNLKRRSVVSTM